MTTPTNSNQQSNVINGQDKTQPQPGQKAGQPGPIPAKPVDGKHAQDDGRGGKGDMKKGVEPVVAAKVDPNASHKR